MESEESLFLIFTSGSSAEPKIITHSQAGYLLYAAVTHKVQHQMVIFVKHCFISYLNLSKYIQEM